MISRQNAKDVATSLILIANALQKIQCVTSAKEKGTTAANVFPKLLTRSLNRWKQKT